MNPKTNSYWKATLEVAFIVFLFYSNLLMGEYNHSGQAEAKGLLWALEDIFTLSNFIIAIISATVGHFFFDYLRNNPIRPNKKRNSTHRDIDT